MEFKNIKETEKEIEEFGKKGWATLDIKDAKKKWFKLHERVKTLKNLVNWIREYDKKYTISIPFLIEKIEGEKKIIYGDNDYIEEQAKDEPQGERVFNQERIIDLKEKWKQYNMGWSSSKNDIPKELYEIIEEIVMRLEK